MTTPTPRRISNEDLAALLEEAFARPINPQVLENYTFCRDTGDIPDTAATRAGITGEFDRYETRYQRQKNGDR